VCDDGFTLKEAVVACRSVYTNPSAATSVVLNESKVEYSGGYPEWNTA